MDGMLENAANLEAYVSQHLLCPITHCIMDQPVVAPSGNSYDRPALMAWLGKRAVDPLSGTPLSASSVYPNRALQEEIANQLQSLARQAGDPKVAAAAEARLQHLASLTGTGHTVNKGAEEAFLDLATKRCASWGARCGDLAREQFLVFLTSLGSVLCLVMDLRNGRGGPPEVRQPLLPIFVRIAVIPWTAVPRHWGRLSQLNLYALRAMLLVPVASTGLALVTGGVLSVFRFAQRLVQVRGVEQERTAQSRLWTQIRDIGGAIAGFASFGLYLRLFFDTRPERRR